MSESLAPRDPSPAGDPFVELRYALAEADAQDAPPSLRERVLSAARDLRSPGRFYDQPAHISGLEVLRRTIADLDELLGSLSADEWATHALRDLDVQGLVGHLTGVEEAFTVALRDETPGAEAHDHVAMTQPAALRQSGRPGAETHREWFDAATDTLRLAADLDPDGLCTFYGVTMPLDSMLVIRAFEMWTHDEDIRRAVGRPVTGPEPESLARMVDLVAALLPAGVALAGRARPGETVRLVLTGPGGGTWDVNLDGASDAGVAMTRVVVDATEFCRVVANRASRSTVDAVVAGDDATADDVFAGAAALALD